MAKKLVIIMANTDPRNGEELGAPIFQASVAAAMDYEVAVSCAATAGRIKDAHEAGVKFFCCSPNLDLFDMKQDDLIPECSGIVGGAYLIEEVMEGDDTKVLSY
jgi:predicted peroxiredoxin